MSESGVIIGHSAVSASRLLRPDKRTLLAGFRTNGLGPEADIRWQVAIAKLQYI
jgi:hypothetical protein